MDVTMIKKADLHMHSVYSDGTDGPEELIAAAANAMTATAFFFMNPAAV